MEPKEPITPAEEDNKTEVELEEETTEVKTEVETKKETEGKTMEEILGEKKEETVPLATFLDLKKDKKEAERKLKEIQDKIDEGSDKTEISEDLQALAEEYEIDPKFLDRLSKSIYAKAKAEVDNKLKPLEVKEKEEKINKIFNEHFEKAIDEMPEYSEVVNKDVIKALSLLPENSKKTFQQIIEETYGKTVSGKKTMEPGTPRGGKDIELDFSKMTDPAYYKQVMQNPELKKKYNEGMAGRLRL